MNNRERILNTFAHTKIDRVAFSPRIHYWYRGNNVGQLTKNIEACHAPIPEEFWGKTLMQIFDLLDAAPRYPGEVGAPSFFRTKVRDGADLKLAVFMDDNMTDVVHLAETPLGDIIEKLRPGPGGAGSYHIERPIKTVADIPKVKYYLENMEFIFDQAAFENASEMFGPRGEPTGYFSRSPYQRMVLEFLGFEGTTRWLRKYPAECQDLMDAISAYDDRVYKVLEKSPLKIINFGENIDANLAPPNVYEKFHIPYYRKRVQQLHAKGKYCFIHVDGSVKNLLPYLKEIDFDGYEALTPEPQGDVTLEEIKDTIGDKILVDGIAATLFMSQFSDQEFTRAVQRILELFSPNLILGVSDELPPNGEIRKAKLVSKIIDEFAGEG